MIAAYLHSLDPVLVKFNEFLKIHWYGLAYVMGFVCAYLLMVRLARRGIGELKPHEVGDFITYTAIFGVLVGGRLGYMLLYNREEFFANPLSIVYLTRGGMASHGGILGIFFFTLYYAWRHQKSWPGLGDNLVCVAPVGVFFGRMANFINGELWGHRVRADFPLAVQFPTELREDAELLAQAQQLMPGMLRDASPDAIIAAARKNSEVATALREVLPVRHPSQLYEAALEGVLLFAILYLVRIRWPKAPHGLLTGLFFIFYAVFRMFVEHYFRVADGMIAGMSRGFFYSTFMIGIGAAFLIYAATAGRKHRGTLAEN
ncbi:MAG: prolipoprotein diacylglyceryl transferase [Verrucomicrobiales bacterium]|nr:prolipoprotein diacylglyceryl transferase [Verrucomicrobiales bacterium]